MEKTIKISIGEKTERNLLEKKEEKLLEEGEKFCNCGRLEDAQACFEEVLRKNPENNRAQEGLNQIKLLLLRKLVREVKRHTTKKIYKLLKSLIRDFEILPNHQTQSQIMNIAQSILNLGKDQKPGASTLIKSKINHMFDGTARNLPINQTAKIVTGVKTPKK